ncbi:DUF742 domain-containing protein [Streptomyces sp. NPDC092903]|uniref:DUF742 domain-containing protein n=1 Tax=Streptomyces sp. NPDC092903 TaxID=3366017 RepID=UPI00381A8FDF
MERGEVWLRPEESEVRPYGLTSGRTEPAHPLPLEAVLIAGESPHSAVLGREAVLAVELCAGEPRSVAELVAVLKSTWRLPVQVVKILLSDLIDAGRLELTVSERGVPGSETDLLARVLMGLQAKWPGVRPGGPGGDCAAA